VVAIREFPRPTSLRKLQEFMGLVNFHHRFIRHCATLLDPLNNLLSNPGSNTRQLLWNEQASTAFTAVKEALAEATLLSHPKPHAPTFALWPTTRNAQWVLFYNKKWLTVGPQLRTSPGGSAQQRGSTAPSTVNFWQCTSPLNVSATLLKNLSSSYLQITNH
jgi:hypothetical protein